MQNTTLIAYGVTFVALYLSLTSIPQAIIGGLIGRATGNILIGGLCGGIISWLIISWLWKTFEGGVIPAAALVGAFVFLLGHSALKKNELMEASHMMIAAEQWAIVIVGVIIAFQAGSIRWY